MGASAAQMARALIEHVRTEAIVDSAELTRDPRGALESDTSVEVRWVQANSLPVGCSIAATYNKSFTPARISIAKDTSPGRRRFSLLHEYGHHLRNQVPEVLQALFAAKGRSAAFEEKICDAFASFILIPEEVRQTAFADGVTAAAVVQLMNSSSASEEAVAVAAAESMSEPGYVLLLNADAEAQFAARSGDVYPVTRGTPQTGEIARAAAGILVRGIATIDRGGGVRTSELHIDSAAAARHAVVVAIDGPAPWTRFSGGRSTYSAPVEGFCDSCTKAYTTYITCRTCDEPKCPDCGGCTCASPTVAGERTCVSCWTTQPPAAFASPSSARCLACE